MRRSVGVDIGGTNLRAALLDEKGAILDVHREKVRERSVQGLAESVRLAIASLKDVDATCPVGVGIAGSVRAEEGVVAVAPQLGWREEPFGKVLEEKLGRAVRLVNDLSAICYGEAKLGAGEGAKDVVCLAVGTGVGVGVVARGALLEGTAGLATEFGHVRIDLSPTARQCNCGQVGCIEAYIAGTHLPARLKEVAASKGIESPLLAQQEVNATVIENAYVAGDAAACALWEDNAVKLAWAMGSALMTFNPKVLVLGGGVLNTSPSLVARAREHVDAFAWKSFLEATTIAPSTLGDDAGILGSGLIARDER